MKARRLTEILSAGAVAMAVWSAPGFAQTAINVPGSIDDFNNIDALDATTDACADLAQTYEQTLTYVEFLNKSYCAAKKAALDKEVEIADSGLQGDVDATLADKDAAATALELAEADYETAVNARSTGYANLVALQEAVTAAQAEKDAKAAALADAYEVVAADFFASNSDAGNVQEYIDANGDDENVQAYLAALADFEAGRAAVTSAQENVTTFEEGEYAELVANVDAAVDALYGVDGALETYNAALTAYNDAVTALDTANTELETLNSDADTALASNVAGRNDDILASTDNPAKAILETSDCLASGAEDCDNDVGQAIVDGVDSLHQADLSLGERIDDEEAARIAGDLALGERIDDEEAARIAGDLALGERIDDEEAARVAGDLALGERIDDEEAARIAADEVLQANIDQEVADRKAADTVLQANIDTEVTDRKAADTVLQANIDKEVTDRKAADATLTTAISNEASARAAADIVLDNKITNVNNRVTQLGERVDALTKESRQGIAMAMALAAIPTVNYGKFSLGVGVGSFASETAAAIGVDFVISERVKFKVGFTTTSDESGGSAGFAIGF